MNTTTYLKAKITIRVDGISGPWEKIVSYNVIAPSVNDAKVKFERVVTDEHKHMLPQSIKFEYLEIAPTI